VKKLDFHLLQLKKIGLGMQVEQTIQIKKLDADFWDSLKDIEE
jgi:hypothetical protein|tara:strand:+ start:26 stop:154 length:129 start_codon:yes stop_codon:yes gene_type:complete